MDFFVQKGSSQDNVIYVILKDGGTTVFRHGWPGDDDSIDGWCIRLRDLLREAPEELKILLDAVPHLLETSVSEDAYPTYQNVLYAVVRFLEQPVSQEPVPDEEVPYIHLYRQLERFLFRFQVERQLEHYWVTFSMAGRDRWQIQIPCNEFGEAPAQVCRAVLRALYRNEPGRLYGFVENYRHFQVGVADADPTTVELFVGLSKALIHLIRQPVGDLGLYASLLPRIYEFVVTNELHIGQRKACLDEFAATEGDYATRLRVFDNIMRGLKRDQRNPALARQTAMFIVERYLKVYDLDSAAEVLKDIVSWKQRGSITSRLLLKMTGAMYRRAVWWAVALGVLVVVLMGPALVKASSISMTAQMYRLLECVSLIVLALFYLGVILLPAFVLYKSRADEVPYFHLFFPRIFGATVVGFVPLVFDNTSWCMAARSGLFAIILMGILSYLAWAMYLYVDTSRRLAVLQSSEWRSVMRASGQIFWIGLMQSVSIAVIVSTLFSHEFMDSELRGIRLDCFIGQVGIYPTLIFLWAGMALFIGAFAQLLWQA